MKILIKLIARKLTGYLEIFLLELYYLEADLFIMTVMHHIFVVYNSLGIYLD